MTILFSGPGVYVTVGGFLVEFNTNRSTKKEFSPGTNGSGETIHEAGLSGGRGWTWHEDGTISLDGPWSAKLRLSQKLDLPSIPAPPSGFKYAGGYPMFRVIEQNEYAMTLCGTLYKHISTTQSCGHYIPLEKIEPKYYECDSPDPNYVIREGDQYFYCDEWHDCGGYGSCIGKTVGYAFKPILKMRSLSPFPTKKPSIVNGAGFYLTKAGYVVELNRFRSYEGSPVPGVNKLGITGGPWQWEVDGSINNMKPEWADKLQIVSRAEFSELPIIPLGYKWVDGYPQYRKPKKDEWFFLAGFTHPVKATADKDTHHFIVEQEEVWYTVNNPDYIFVEGDQYYSVAYGKWMDINSALGKTVRIAQFAANCRSINKEACLSNVVKDIAVKHVELPDINFNLEKVTDLPATLVKPSLLKRSFNYWVIEPASNAFRYVVITAVLWGGVEVYKNPAVVWKILPKISVTMD